MKDFFEWVVLAIYYFWPALLILLVVALVLVGLGVSIGRKGK